MPQMDPRWRTAGIWINGKILISSQPINKYWRNLACWCFSTFSTPLPIKFRDFKNPRWRQQPFLKFEKSQYLHNGMTTLTWGSVARSIGISGYTCNLGAPSISHEWLKLELLNFVRREIVSSLARGMTNHPWKERGLAHVTHFWMQNWSYGYLLFRQTDRQ